MSTTVGEAPSNWLSDIIKLIRDGINVRRERRELRLEVAAIIAELRKNPMGQELASKPDIEAVLEKALHKANEVEEEIRRNPSLMTGSPAIQASWVVFDHYGMARDN